MFGFGKPSAKKLAKRGAYGELLTWLVSGTSKQKSDAMHALFGVREKLSAAQWLQVLGLCRGSLVHGPADVRCSALFVLGENGDAADVPSFLTSMRDPDAMVGIFASNALSRQSPPGSARAIAAMKTAGDDLAEEIQLDLLRGMADGLHGEAIRGEAAEALRQLRHADSR